MACYNARQFIQEAIESVLGQTYTNLELIIVDDASNDNSFELAQEAARRDSRILVHSLGQNMGPGTARNVAISLASGEWLAVLDADDVFVRTKLERQIELIDCGERDLVLVGANSFQIDAQGHRLRSQKYPAKSDVLRDNLIRMRRFPPHSSLMYRASAVRELGGFNSRFVQSEDYDLWLRLSPLGAFGLVTESLIEYRLHEGNLSQSKAGTSQQVCGIAAVVCHFLRASKFPDPSVSIDESQWRAFVRWIAGQLRGLGIHEFEDGREVLRGYLNDSHECAVTFKSVIRLSMKNLGVVGRTAWEVLFGRQVAQELAERWMSTHQATT